MWIASEQVEYDATFDVSAGSGTFNGLFTAISEVYTCEIPDGACDCAGNVLDECGVCDGPGAIYECGCSDIADGACDCDGNVEDCAGICGGDTVVDECGECGGDGADLCWDGSGACDLTDCPIYYNVEIEETGESSLFIFEDTITSLSPGDEIGLFDSNGFIDSDGNTGEILVGTGVWNGSQLDVVGIQGVDLSQFGGPILPLSLIHI